MYASHVRQLDRLLILDNGFVNFHVVLHNNSFCIKRDKKGFNCDKQVERVVTVLNCMLKGLWGEVENRGIKKKLKG